MYRKLQLTLIGIFFLSFGYAQVEDVSVIISPTAGYNWFDKKSTVEDGLMYGIQAGFGFGRVIELRGIYERSANLKQAFGKYEDDIQSVIPGFNLANRNVIVTRYGGEFKTNIPAGGFSPYILLGTGVQKFERSFNDNLTYKTENLYGTGGLGLKINMGDRTTLNLEGRGIVYNMDPKSLLYNPGGSSDFDDWINNQKAGRMFNWNLQAALQFYLGGRTASEQDALDRVYRNRYSGGMGQTKLTLAPAAGYINFNDKSAYRNTYLMGGILGLDFTHFIGLRGYYYQATNDQEFAFDFDKLSMYGVDFIGNLNVARGIVPYITIGGGYLNVQEGYQGKNVGTPALPLYQEARSGYFAKGGVGLTVPLGQYVDIFGAANLIYTVDDKDVDIAGLQSADQLNQHTMFNGGIKLKLGKKARTENTVDRYYDQRFNPEREAYERRIRNLEMELQAAIDSNDTDKVVQLMNEKKEIAARRNAPADTLIRLTSADLERIIEKSVNEIEIKTKDSSFYQRLDSLQNILKNLKQQQPAPVQEQRIQQESTPIYQENTIRDTVLIRPDDNTVMRHLIDELNLIKRELKNQNETLQNLKTEKDKSDIIINKDDEAQAEKSDKSRSGRNDIYEQDNSKVIKLRPTPIDQSKSVSIFAGPGFGDFTTLNLGARWLQNIGNTPVKFMPEVYIGLGKKTGFGLSANAIYEFTIDHPDFIPYVGLGAGINQYNDKLRFNPNVIIGTFYKMKTGQVFADYSVRGAFRYNQLAIGYNFKI